MPTSEKFEEEYAKLNQKQKDAVDMIEGPVMVIAGPGTGKTTILTLRIANILRLTDTHASGILALTFTEAGVRAMREKLRKIIGERAFEVPIHTFHGFAASVKAEFQDHFPETARSEQITDVESEKLLCEILKDKKFAKLRPLGEPDFYINKIIGAIGDSKQEAWTPEMLTDFARAEIERVKSDPTSISTRGESKGKLKGEALKRIDKCEKTLLFAQIYEEYEKRKKEDRKIDFDDLLFELLYKLREDKLLLQLLQEKYLYILVDEHQDTNDTQNLIVKSLADFFESPNLFVVGDEKQAIYRFQGASVENFLKFQEAWKNMRIINLEENYRSHQSLLDASFKMIEQNYGSTELLNLRQKLLSNKDGKHSIEIVEAPDSDTEDLFLVSKLKEIIKTEKGKTVAVITKKNIDVSRILSLLEENGVPASAERGANIFSHPLGSAFFAFINFLYNQSEVESLAETFGYGLWKLEFTEASDLIKKVRSGKLEEVKKQIPTIDGLLKEISRSAPLQFLGLAGDISGLSEMASKDPLSAEVWRAIFELGKDLTIAEQIENPHKLMERLLGYKKTAEKRVIKIKSGSPFAQITVLTAHSAKGLEFDYVFLPFAVEESWITKNRSSFFVLPREKGGEDDLKDDRRLFYVALTRAKEKVTVSFPLKDGGERGFSPLRFILELDNLHTTETKLEKIKKERETKTLEKIKIEKNKIKVEYAKTVLIENGLSVTALNHFLTCPSEFFYKSILKLPEPPTPSSEKGNAMHEAMNRVWGNPTRLTGTIPLVRGGKKGELDPSHSQGEGPSEARGGEVKTIENIIIKTVKEYLHRSLLPIFEKEIIEEELIKDAPKVAASLLDHFRKTGNISTESWFESHFKHKVGEEEIEVRLHGKIDAVVEKETEIDVFDYKTREGMSENEIRGNTKNSTGDYFRQLVFYKFLLENPLTSKKVSKRVEPSLIFLKPDSKGRCQTVNLPIEKGDTEKLKSEIASLIESVWSGRILSENCPEKDCKYCKSKNL